MIKMITLFSLLSTVHAKVYGLVKQRCRDRVSNLKIKPSWLKHNSFNTWIKCFQHISISIVLIEPICKLKNLAQTFYSNVYNALCCFSLAAFGFKFYRIGSCMFYSYLFFMFVLTTLYNKSWYMVTSCFI